jgi:hypothetical protein
MTRRLARVPTPAIAEPLADAKKQMVDAICSKLRDVNTFVSIGVLIGYGRNFVSKRLKAEFENNPGALFKIGDDYRIPRATAEKFIRDLYRF